MPEYAWGGLVAAVAIASASVVQYVSHFEQADLVTVPSPAGLPSQDATVVRVVGGTSLLVRLENGRRRTVTLTGVVAPRFDIYGREECYAREAVRGLAEELPAGTAVRLETDPRAQAGPGGALARYVWRRDGRDWILVNKQVIVQGFASTSYPMTALRYEREMTAAHARAVAEGRGRWAACPS